VTFREQELLFWGYAPPDMAPEKFRIAKDTPAPYITMVAKYRLPVFQTDVIYTITCKAIDEARQSHGFLLFAYVICMLILTESNGKEGHNPILEAVF